MEVRAYSTADDKLKNASSASLASKNNSTHSKKSSIPDKGTKKTKSIVSNHTVIDSKKKDEDPIDQILKAPQTETAPDDLFSDMLRSSDPIFVAKEKAAKDIAFIFDPRIYEGDVHYSRDGNSAFYTKENEKKRENLKTNSTVQDAIHGLMNIYNFDSNGNIAKAEYIRIHSCIARILRQDLKDTMIEQILEQDWKHDAKGKEYMDSRDVYGALFELGDIWTPEIDEILYAAFFEELGKILRGQKELKNHPRAKMCIVLH